MEISIRSWSGSSASSFQTIAPQLAQTIAPHLAYWLCNTLLEQLLFSILHWNGKPSITIPCSERQKAKKFLSLSQSWTVIDNFPLNGPVQLLELVLFPIFLKNAFLMALALLHREFSLCPSAFQTDFIQFWDCWCTSIARIASPFFFFFFLW